MRRHHQSTRNSVNRGKLNSLNSQVQNLINEIDETWWRGISQFSYINSIPDSNLKLSYELEWANLRNTFWHHHNLYQKSMSERKLDFSDNKVKLCSAHVSNMIAVNEIMKEQLFILTMFGDADGSQSSFG